MTATTFDPTAISLTDAARAHIAAQIARSGHRYLRLGVKESGCNGFMYTLDYIDAPGGDDHRFEFGDVDVYVQEEDLPVVLGTEIDFTVEGLNASLKFKNPRAASYCGCGESFHPARLSSTLERRLIAITRDCPARLVPTGDPVTIPGNTFVTLTQSLGGTYTVIVNGNMARIDGEDADALGFEPHLLTFKPPEDGRVSEAQVKRQWPPVYDPEIPVNIVDLGLVYGVHVDGDSGVVSIEMTLTAPGCGMGDVLVAEVKRRVGRVPFVRQVDVTLVFDPPWSRDRMTEEAQLTLGLY